MIRQFSCRFLMTIAGLHKFSRSATRFRRVVYPPTWPSFSVGRSGDVNEHGRGLRILSHAKFMWRLSRCSHAKLRDRDNYCQVMCLKIVTSAKVSCRYSTKMHKLSTSYLYRTGSTIVGKPSTVYQIIPRSYWQVSYCLDLIQSGFRKDYCNYTC